MGKIDMSIALTTPKPEKLVVHDSGPAAYLFDTARFEHCYRIAKAMAQASLIPEHLTHVGNRTNKRELPLEMVVGNCFMILNQAIRWGIDPFALPAETYVVGNKLGFQGKLVAAVVNARAGLHGSLSVIYNGGKGDELAAVLFGSEGPIPKEAWPLLKQYAKDESGDAYTDLMALGVRSIRVSVGQAKTDNQMWRSDPQQKLFYTGATKWARRHCPEILLGVMTDDDLERMKAIEPATSHASGPVQIDNLDALTDRLTGQRPSSDSVDGLLPENEESEAGEADEANESAAETPTDSDSEPEYDIWKEARDTFDDQTELAGVSKWEAICSAQFETPENKAEVARLAEAARERIRASRGSGSNKQKTMPGV